MSHSVVSTAGESRSWRSRAMTRVVVAALVTMATLSLPLRGVEAQLTVDELELHMPTSGSPAVRTVRVRNDAAERVQAVVSIEDWDRDDTGANRFVAAGSNAHSCATGLEVFPASLALEPGESANLRVSLAGSAIATPNCWSVVFLENRATQTAGNRQLSYNVRTGIKVYGEAAGAVRDGVIEEMALDSTVSGQLAVAFRNAGDVQLVVKGAIEVRRADNSLVHRADVDPFPVLPTQRRRLTSVVPDLPVGRYVVLALLDFGGSELVAGQMEYEVR
jgi:P pilus assembly chaperone PapD